MVLREDFKNTDIEIIVQVRAFDEVFSNTVVQRTSMFREEIVYGAKFVPMYYPIKTISQRFWIWIK
jgi:inward rectifier potassium channel